MGILSPRRGLGCSTSIMPESLASTWRPQAKDISWLLNKLPFVGEPTKDMLSGIKDAVRTSCTAAGSSKSLGFRYIGPVDGHDLASRSAIYMEMVKDVKGPVLLHVFTEKGRGFKFAEKDPVAFHTPAPFCRSDDDEEGVQYLKKPASRAYTDAVSDAIHAAMERDSRVCVLTAAMCEGNKLRQDPQRFSAAGSSTSGSAKGTRSPLRGDGQGGDAADRRHLQHVPAAELRPHLPGSVAARTCR